MLFCCFTAKRSKTLAVRCSLEVCREVTRRFRPNPSGAFAARQPAARVSAGRGLAGFWGETTEGSLLLHGEAFPQPAPGLNSFMVSSGPPERGLRPALQHLPQTAENQDGVSHQGEHHPVPGATARAGPWGAEVKDVAMARCRAGAGRAIAVLSAPGSSPLSWLR